MAAAATPAVPAVATAASDAALAKFNAVAITVTALAAICATLYATTAAATAAIAMPSPVMMPVWSAAQLPKLVSNGNTASRAGSKALPMLSFASSKATLSRLNCPSAVFAATAADPPKVLLSVDIT